MHWLGLRAEEGGNMHRELSVGSYPLLPPRRITATAAHVKVYRTKGKMRVRCLAHPLPSVRINRVFGCIFRIDTLYNCRNVLYGSRLQLQMFCIQPGITAQLFSNLVDDLYRLSRCLVFFSLPRPAKRMPGFHLNAWISMCLQLVVLHHAVQYATGIAFRHCIWHCDYVVQQQGLFWSMCTFYHPQSRHRCWMDAPGKKITKVMPETMLCECETLCFSSFTNETQNEANDITSVNELTDWWVVFWGASFCVGALYSVEWSKQVDIERQSVLFNRYGVVGCG